MVAIESDKIARRELARAEVKAVELNLQQVLDDAIDRGVLVVPFNGAISRFLAHLRVRQQLIKV